MKLDELIEKRRSYRSIDSFKVTRELVDRLATAASLAPSCFNNQPWRFIFAYKPDEKAMVDDALSQGNKWAHNGGMYVLVLSKKDLDCVVKDREYYLFDTGMAFAFLQLKAVDEGLVIHAMAGFDEEKIKKDFMISKDYTVITVAAIGKHSKSIWEGLNTEQIKTEEKRPPRMRLERFAFHNDFRD